MLVTRSSALGCLVAVVIIALFGMAGESAAQLLNAGFESPDASGGDVPGTADWETFNQVYTTAAIAHSGSQSLKTFGPFVPGGGTGARQARPAMPGETWIGEIYAQNWSGDPIDNVDFGVYKIEFLNSNFELAAGGLFGVDIFESNPISAATPPDVWLLLGVGTAPAPPGTAYARAVIVKVDVDGAQGGSIFWDDATLLRPAEDAPEIITSLSFDLQANTPNPFNPATRIGFVLNESDHVDISVYDVGGRHIATLLQSRLGAGSHSAIWDGRMANGAAAPAGVYRYVLRTSTGTRSRSMILVR